MPSLEEKGTTWPLAVFLGLGLLVAPSAFGLSLFTIWGGAQGLAQAFMEGGFWMYLLMLGEMLGVVVCCAISYFYVVSRKISASLLLILACLPIMIGFLGAKIGVTEVDSALSMASPDMVMPFAYRGLAIVSHIITMSGLVAASMAGLILLMGACRALAHKRSKPIDKLGLPVMVAGLLIGLCGFGATSFTSEPSVYPIMIGLSGLVAVICVGLTALMPIDDWRGGVNRWLVAFSAPALVGFTWMAMRSAALSSWAGVMDQAAPEQRVSYITRGLVIGQQADLAGWVIMAIVTMASVANVVFGGRATIAGAARFRISAALATLFAILTLSLALWHRSSEQSLLQSALQSRAAYHADRTEGFRPTLSQSPYSIRARQPVVVVTPDHIFVDDHQVAATQGFASKGPGGPELAKALTKALEDQLAARRAEEERLDIPNEEIEDWLNDQDDRDDGPSKGEPGRENAKTSDNRYGIKGPADNPDPHLASPRSARYESVAMAVHPEVPFGVVREAMRVIRQLEVASVDFLVRPSDVRPLSEIDEEFPEVLRAAMSEWGRIPVVLGMGECSGDTRPREHRYSEGLDLAMRITGEGFILTASGGVLPEGCASNSQSSGPTVPLRDQVSSCIDSDGYPSAAQRNERTSKGLGAPPCAFNFERLGECLRRIKEEYPEDSQIIVTADPSVDHQILVRALDVARNPSTSSERLGPTYTEPYGYDALAFADVFLFTGENLEQSCHQPRPTAPDEGPIGLGKLPTIGFGGPSVPAIRIGTAEVRGSLSKEVIRRYIRRNINQVRYCYERQLAGHPELEGNVQIRFIISPSGAVTSSSVASSTLGDSEVEECVARTIQRIAFPEPEGGGVVIVTYPFRFQTAE